MKNLKFIVALSLAIVFASCSSDDDNGGDIYEFTKENLTGIYQLKTFSSLDEKYTVIDEDFDPIKTTTTSEGDTFNLTYDFAENDEVTLNGNFRVEQVKEQGNNSTDTTYIVNYNEEVLSYSINEEERTLTIDGREYEVKGFESSGFELRHADESVDENGNTKKYSEKMRFQN